MSFEASHPPALERSKSLRRYNTLQLDATAEYFVEVTSLQQLQQLLGASPAPLALVLGGGSNVVLTSDIPGLVVLNRILGKQVVAESDTHLELVVGAGENWDELVRYCVERDLWGIENLGLIPGTVGAAPIQNIGAYGVELESVLLWLDAFNTETGELCRFSRATCRFGYRHSLFKEADGRKFIITQVAFGLSKEPIPQLSYGELAQKYENIDSKDIKALSVYQSICDIRRAKLPDPLHTPNVGSFFKNPIIEPHLFADLLRQYPSIPHYLTADGAIKLAAGWLIDKAGWKGKRVGAVGVHDRQALVLINPGLGSAREVLDLAQKIVADVERQFGIALEVEPTIYPPARDSLRVVPIAPLTEG
ncbi:UDP-N-acetylmuramate dehydrogenase [Halioxenophilus sp. WMMB6]|uniref:UDP-N-acetylmuramate dehydrogenase n=1 Tax=Halioxenophilus sp. WMMB6 TaxID=3073815 RepID=UPI00295F3765|nr:UDP-N-acetylmuramate dehydrogenase [Halioxenophilus sp. WMMB6]